MLKKIFLTLLFLLLNVPLLFGVEYIVPYGTTEIKNSEFWERMDLTSVTIPDGVVCVEDGAFNGCSGLTSVTIPGNVTSIGNEAFRDCSSLASVTIPDGVTSIGNYAFYNCSSLTSITIPSSVTSIGVQAFYGCGGLEFISLPASATQSISSDAFDGCNNVTRVDFPTGIPANEITFGTSNPTVHASNYSYNGYNTEITSSDESKITAPKVAGKVGQVLMMTENGTEWVTLPGISSLIPDSFQLKTGWNLFSMPDAELTASCKEELLKAYEFFTFDSSKKAIVEL